MSRTGILLVVSGPSGSGKTTLCRRLADEEEAGPGATGADGGTSGTAGIITSASATGAAGAAGAAFGGGAIMPPGGVRSFGILDSAIAVPSVRLRCSAAVLALLASPVDASLLV